MLGLDSFIVDFCPTLVLLEYDGGDSMQVSMLFTGMELYKHLNVSFAAFNKKVYNSVYKKVCVTHFYSYS